MGTRGFYGFVVKGEEKIGYTHWGGHPEGVGIDLLTWASGVSPEEWDEIKELAAAVRPVTNEIAPTDEDIEKCKPWTDLGVSERSTSDWYCLLRHAQGDVAGMLETGYVMDNHEFPLDSLMCEGGALVDLDTMRFEYYHGFIHEPHQDGRYASRLPDGRDGYYPCRLAASWPLDELPSGEEFLAATTSEQS
jgi:hypothetical protein